MMEREDIELLLSLLEKANDCDLLHIYDSDDRLYGIDWIYTDMHIDNKICIKIKEY